MKRNQLGFGDLVVVAFLFAFTTGAVQFHEVQTVGKDRTLSDNTAMSAGGRVTSAGGFATGANGRSCADYYTNGSKISAPASCYAQ